MSSQPTAAQLAPAIAHSGSPVLFALAGRTVAAALVGGTWDRDTDTIVLLDAMERRLPDVARATAEHVHGPLLVELSAAMAALAFARPHLERGVRHALRDLVDRTPPTAWIADPELLPLRGLLALAVDREVLARDTALELDRREDDLGAALVRWVAGQRHRGQRASRHRALQALTRRLPQSVPPTLLAMAAFALPEPTSTVRPAVAPRRALRPVSH